MFGKFGGGVGTVLGDVWEGFWDMLGRFVGGIWEVFGIVLEGSRSQVANDKHVNANDTHYSRSTVIRTYQASLGHLMILGFL